MNYTFSVLSERIIDSVNNWAINKTKKILNKVRGNVIIIGTGGSLSVAKFTERVLEEKNKNCFVYTVKPRDILYKNIDAIDCIIAFTYSGKTASVLAALNSMKCKKIIFTFDKKELETKLNSKKNCFIIDYSNKYKRERSFISISSILIPMFLIYSYFLKEISVERTIHEAKQYIDNIFCDIDFSRILTASTIEILTGDNTYTAATILDSNMIESGIAYTVSHEKNHYCHGRSILNYNKQTDMLIYLQNGKEQKQDTILYKYINKFYKNVFIINSDYGGIQGELDLALKCMFLSKKIASDLGINLSKINYPDEIRNIYSFRNFNSKKK